MKGLVFNIQRYSIHDGGGIRTIVFLKGCPLYCPWCSNPESQSFNIEKVKIQSKCINCSKCSFDVDECPSGAITNIGKYMSVKEVMNEITKDTVFFNTSSGGVTLSGGEPLAQPIFTLELLKSIKNLNIHTAIETTGHVKLSNLNEFSKYIDLILFDFKIIDENKSKDIIGADINLIKENFKTFLNLGTKIIPRIPLIPGYTMDTENILKIIKFLKNFPIEEIHILPFHQYGSSKYDYLNKEYKLKDIEVPTDTKVKKIKTLISKEGFNVIVGGV